MPVTALSCSKDAWSVGRVIIGVVLRGDAWTVGSMRPFIFYAIGLEPFDNFDHNRWIQSTGVMEQGVSLGDAGAGSTKGVINRRWRDRLQSFNLCIFFHSPFSVLSICSNQAWDFVGFDYLLEVAD
ncbi:hypothetical protein A2U01_0010755 [Trifolium medium]|uniref:Uncharacterized protein n=1 Tax=Trifolium medium TaxID=97028 RepID=A0A392MRH8_9FABA|nr:hypothetical protein [Trifolium medium]